MCHGWLFVDIQFLYPKIVLMKQITLILLLFVSLHARSQNLVPNPNFALYTTCPDNYSQITRCEHWYSSNVGTPDFFHNCATGAGSTWVGVPSNIFGYQSNDAGAYAGAITYVTGSTSWLKENIVTDIPALIVGKTYKVTVRVSLGDSSRFATDGFGVYFYTYDSLGIYWGMSDKPFPRPQIDYGSYGILTNKTSWVTMTQTFVADSAYKHMVVGVLKPDTALHTSVDPTCTRPQAYYYYDSVAVERIFGASTEDVENGVRVSQYPNPFHESCTILIDRAPVKGHYETTIYNAMGVAVKQISSDSHEFTIQRDQLPTGMYIYKIQSNESTIYTGRLMIY